MTYIVALLPIIAIICFYYWFKGQIQHNKYRTTHPGLSDEEFEQKYQAKRAAEADCTRIRNSPETAQIIEAVVQCYRQWEHTYHEFHDWNNIFFRSDGIYFTDTDANHWDSLTQRVIISPEIIVWRYKEPPQTQEGRQLLINLCADELRRRFDFTYVHLETDFEAVSWNAEALYS